MASNKSYYTCSPYTTPQLLRTSGEEPVEVTLNYVYELDVPTITTSDEETTTTILDLATQHISSTLLKRIATISNLVDCSDIHHSDPFRRRRLRFRGGRGSNSLIGIASDGSSVNTEKVCQFNVSGSEVKEVEQFIEGVTGDFSGSVVVMEAEEEEQQQGRDDGGVDAIGGGGGGGEVLAETRVDGVIDPASVIRSAPLTTTQLEEIKEEGGSAYNYLSTQSEIKEAKSIRTQPTVGENSGVSLRQSSVNTVMMTPPKLRSGGTAGTTCNVIQGQITLFISNIADPFENLDGRILEAIKDDLNDDMIIQQEFMNNEVVGLRLLEPAMVDKLPSSPSVSVTAPAVAAAAAAAASSPSNTNDAAGSSGFASSNASIGVIGGLGAILLMLIGLFAYTSRPRKRGRYHLDDDDLNSCQYDDDKYENELDVVSAVLRGKDSSSSWWQEPVRMNDSIDSRSVMESSIPTVEACYSTEGVIIGNDDIDEAFAEDKSPKILPLSFFNRKSKSRDEETDATSNIVGGDLMKSESLLDEEQSQSTVDMDAHLFGSAEESKPRNAKSFGSRLFGRKRTTDIENDDALIDDDVVIEEIQSRAKTEDEEVLIQESYSQDAFGIETTRTAPSRPMSAYVSPSTVSSRSRGPNDYYAERALQSCASGALSSCIPDLPSPEIGDEQSYISALTDNYFDHYSRRGPPACTQTDGEKLMRLAKGAVSQCVAPTDDTSVPTIPTSVPTKQQQQQLARRQPNGNNLDAFADCWNPFEGNFWQGWFE